MAKNNLMRALSQCDRVNSFMCFSTKTSIHKKCIDNHGRMMKLFNFNNKCNLYFCINVYSTDEEVSGSIPGRINFGNKLF